MIYVANPNFLIVEPLNSVRIVDNGKDYLIMNGNTVLYHYSSLKKAKSSIEKLIKIYQPIIVANSYCYSENLDLLKKQFNNVICTSGGGKIEALGNDFVYVFPSEEEL